MHSGSSAGAERRLCGVDFAHAERVNRALLDQHGIALPGGGHIDDGSCNELGQRIVSVSDADIDQRGFIRRSHDLDFVRAEMAASYQSVNGHWLTRASAFHVAPDGVNSASRDGLSQCML